MPLRLEALRTTRAALAFAGLAIVAAIFAAGFLAANAMSDDDTESPAPIDTGGAPGAVAPAIGIGQPGTGVPATGGFVKGTTVTRDGSMQPGAPGLQSGVEQKPGIFPYCQGELPPLVRGNSIDFQGSGLVLMVPSSGFTLRSIGISAQAECDKDGKPTRSVPVINSTWKHDATGVDVFLTQQPSKSPRPAVLRQGQASFSHNNYDFFASVQFAYPAGVERGPVPADAPSSLPYPGPMDPKAQEALKALLDQVAPSLRQDCFYREAAGDWADLKTLGVGDPRSAVPAGFTLQQFQVVVFKSPAANCNQPEIAGIGSFNASWVSGEGTRTPGYLGVSAYRDENADRQQPYPGFIGEGGANWFNRGIQFGVNGGKGEKPLSIAEVRALALAMDPDFGKACLVVQKLLKESDLKALGFRAPLVPDGFKVDRSFMNGQDIENAESCGDLSNYGIPNYNFSWSMTDGDVRIEANVGYSPNAPKPVPGENGYIGPNGLNWMDARGAYYSVYSYGEQGGEGVDRETLIAVAKSLDPTLDVSKLKDEPGFPGGPKPLPVPAGGGTQSGGGAEPAEKPATP